MSLVAEELELSSSTDPTLQDSPTQRIPHNDDNVCTLAIYIHIIYHNVHIVRMKATMKAMV